MTQDSSGLSGWRVLVTRPREQIAALADALRALGAEPIPYPTIELAPPPDWKSLDAALAGPPPDWIVFTSPSAVRFTTGRAWATGANATARLWGSHVAAVGLETARAAAAAGIRVDVTPDLDDQRQEGLARALDFLPAGTRVLFPQTVGGREHLREALVARGCVVEVVAVSQTLPVNDLPPLPAFEAATFASPSALRAFCARWGARALDGAVVAVIGPTTAEAARIAGVRVDAMPATPSMAALAGALADHRARRPPR